MFKPPQIAFATATGIPVEKPPKNRLRDWVLLNEDITRMGGQGEKEKTVTKKTKVESTILRIRDISIVLDTYDDIFSDFDPRSYCERRISEDFLNEIETRCLETKEGGIEVRLVIPDKVRNEESEALIIQRLRTYFENKVREQENDISDTKRHGMKIFGIGAVITFVAGLMELIPEGSGKVFQILKPLGGVLMLPGWFTGWLGLNDIVVDTKPLMETLTWLNKLKNAEFIFIPASKAGLKQSSAGNNPTAEQPHVGGGQALRGATGARPNSGMLPGAANKFLFD